MYLENGREFKNENKWVFLRNWFKLVLQRGKNLADY